MKVRELIERLQKADPEMEVYSYECLSPVRSVYYDRYAEMTWFAEQRKEPQKVVMLSHFDFDFSSRGEEII